MLEFETCFGALHGDGRKPFPWQVRLHDALTAGTPPAVVDIPTGLGKTSAIAAWLLARAASKANDNTARIWDISQLEKGNAFEVACQRLGNNADLSDVIAKYGLRQLTPICGANAPLMPDLTNLQ